MIDYTGIITISERGVSIQEFSFSGDESWDTCAIEAAEWGIKQLEKAIKEQKAKFSRVTP